MREFIRTFKKLDFIFILILTIGLSIGVEPVSELFDKEFIYTYNQKTKAVKDVVGFKNHSPLGRIEIR